MTPAVDLNYVRGRAHDYTMKAETAVDPFWQFYFRMAAAYWQTAAKEIQHERELTTIAHDLKRH